VLILFVTRNRNRDVEETLVSVHNSQCRLQRCLGFTSFLFITSGNSLLLIWQVWNSVQGYCVVVKVTV